MKIYLSILIGISLILFSCTPKEKPIKIKNYIEDDIRQKIETEKIPERIITLAPNLTELVFELGVGSKIVGNTTYCNYPDSAKMVENVSDLLNINFKKISALNPDLIFITTEGSYKSAYRSLVDLGFKVFVANPKDFKGIKKTLLNMGKIFKLEEKAKKIIQDWDLRISNVQKSHNQLVANSAVFFISTNPILSVGKNSIMNQILSFAGLQSITANSKVDYPVITKDDIVIKNPAYIIFYETSSNNLDKLLATYTEWYTISAIVNNRVLYLNADLYSRPGSRFVEAVEKLNKLILEN